MMKIAHGDRIGGLVFPLCTAVFVLIGSQNCICLSQDTANVIEMEWGEIRTSGKANLIELTITKPGPKIVLPSPMPNITRAMTGTSRWPGEALTFSFNEDASAVMIHLPSHLLDGEPLKAVLETSEQPQNFPDGRIVLGAMDAAIDGETAKLESHPGNHRIGFWTDASDSVRWDYNATRPGKYELFLTYSLANSPDIKPSDIEIAIGDSVLTQTLSGTGSWYRYLCVQVGDVHIARPGHHSVTVKCIERRSGAVMNLKALTLIPKCEGTPPKQADDGTVLLHARDSTTHGTLLQWEPAPKKQTIGYWANENDFATWDLEVKTEGVFDIEMLQGCGKGQGGSRVTLTFVASGDEQSLAQFSHTVKDTGHWQAFEPIKIGQVELAAGNYRLRVDATHKAANAVMDLRQIMLRPAR